MSALASYIDRCREAAPEFRWVAPEGLHLTLRFVGTVDAAPLKRLVHDLRGIQLAPFEVGIGGLGSFDRGRLARVLWLGVLGQVVELRRLAGEVEDACVRSGLPAEARAYNPHLTLARARQRRGAVPPPLPEPPRLAPFRVEKFRLYRSRTGLGGAVYSVLEEFG